MILIVSNDAGGAEIVSSWVKRNPNEYCFVLTGPAVNIFKNKINPFFINPETDIEQLILKAEFVLTGTSWQSNIEKIAIILSQIAGKKVASFLDHWVNYPNRFYLNGKLIMPDEIWVGDINAQEIAFHHFPNTTIKLVSNPYFMDIEEEIKANKNLKSIAEIGIKILYCCEPIREHSIKEFGHPNHWCYDEFSAMDNYFNYLLEKLPELGTFQIRIRQHPSEISEKYSEILSKYPMLPIQISVGNTLIADCAWADWVVGCESMALVVGLLAKKIVLSCIPNGGLECQLPQKEIKKLFS